MTPFCRRPLPRTRVAGGSGRGGLGVRFFLAGESTGHYLLSSSSLTLQSNPFIRSSSTQNTRAQQHSLFSHLIYLTHTHTMTVALSSSPAAAATPSSKAVYSAHLTNGDPSKASAAYRPTHPGRFEVSFQSGSYNSSLVTQRRFAKDETLAMMDAAEYCNEKRYSTVQVAQDKHIELNSECVRLRGCGKSLC